MSVEAVQLKTASLIKPTGSDIVILRLQHDARQSFGFRPFNGTLDKSISNPSPATVCLHSDIVDVCISIPILPKADLPGQLIAHISKENDFVRVVNIGSRFNLL